MYKKSIKENTKFLMPFIQGIKLYGSNEIEQGIGTMMVLNKHGDILTCKHTAEQFIIQGELASRYKDICKELSNAKNSNERKKIEKKYALTPNSMVLTEINNPFANNKGESVTFNIILHDTLDMAILRPENIIFEVDNYPVFSKKIPEQGQSVCRLGFAFPEYDIYEYSEKLKAIVRKEKIIASFPVFPIDGIITRTVVDENKNAYAIETSTPGLRGQSGGPIFGPDGLIYGMQYMTKHMDMNIDINMKVKRGVEERKVDYTPFLGLGVGISSTEIIKFLEKNNIEFNSK